MRLVVDVDLEGIRQMLKGMQQRLDHQKLRRFMEDTAGAIIRQDFARQFALGGSPTRWQPLAESTVEQKGYGGYPRLNRRGQASAKLVQRGNFGPENILIRRGDLREAWCELGPDHLCEFRGNALTIGPRDSISYWIYHQSDQPRKLSQKTGKPILPRRPLVLTPETVEKVTAKTVEYILGRS